MDTLGGPEDVLDNHHKRSGAAKKAPNPHAVAQFREGLEKLNKISTGTDKSSVSTKHLLMHLQSADGRDRPIKMTEEVLLIKLLMRVQMHLDCLLHRHMQRSVTGVSSNV